MSEQSANDRKFRILEIIIGVLLTAMLGLLIASNQQTANKVDELDRKVEENSRVLAEVKTTLQLLVSGLNIRIEPKEQAGPAAAPSSGEQLATKEQ